MLQEIFNYINCILFGIFSILTINFAKLTKDKKLMKQIYYLFYILFFELFIITLLLKKTKIPQYIFLLSILIVFYFLWNKSEFLKKEKIKFSLKILIGATIIGIILKKIPIIVAPYIFIISLIYEVIWPVTYLYVNEIKDKWWYLLMILIEILLFILSIVGYLNTRIILLLVVVGYILLEKYIKLKKFAIVYKAVLIYYIVISLTLEIFERYIMKF